MSKMQNAKKNVSLASLEQGKGIEHALRIAYQLLGNPIAVFDVAYNLLAMTDNRVTDDPLWNELRDQGTFSHETVDFFNAEQFIDMYAKSETVALMRSDKLQYDRANGKVFNEDDVQIGNVIVVACYKPFEEGDFALIEKICELVSAELLHGGAESEIEIGFRETFVSKLIDGCDIEKVCAEKEMKKLYTDLKPNLYIAVVDIIQYERTLTHLAYFRNLFERMQREFKYYIHSNYIVIIASTDEPPLSISRDMGKLNTFFTENRIFAGISSSFQNLFEIQKYYRQALMALNFGVDANNGEHIFRYDDYRLSLFLNSIKDTIDIQALCNPIVPLIKRYDQEHHANYYEVLHAYLLCGLNLRLTSEKLGMEQRALESRLKEMEELFGVNWDNGDVLTGIFVSIKVLDTISR